MKILARKGKYIFVEYDCGLFAVEISTKSTGMMVYTSEEKQKAIDYFKSIKARKSKKDFNVELYSA